MARDTTNSTIITHPDMLIEYFLDGEKIGGDLRIGTEHERFAFQRDNLKPVPYSGEKGIGQLLKNLQKLLNWSPILDGENIIGLFDEETQAAMSLEPGGQVELSGAPLRTIHELCEENARFFAALKEAARPLNIDFFNMGTTPLHSRSQMEHMPKSRYEIMRNYMPQVGTMGLDMMHRTATIQTNYDYTSEADMRRKMQIAMRLQPIVTGLFAASPFLDGKVTGYYSTRSYIWRNTDPDRTGILPFVFSPNFSYEDYVQWALDVPMYFVLRNGHYHSCTDISFRQFLSGALKGRIKDYQPNLGDWANHLSTLFPEVRLKRYIEMRGADCGPKTHIAALAALWTGLLYDNTALDQAEALTKNWDYETVLSLYTNVAKEGLNLTFERGKLIDIAAEVVKIAHIGLNNRQNVQNFKDESYYLKPLEIIITSKTTVAEEMLFSYNSWWQKNMDFAFMES